MKKSIAIACFLSVAAHAQNVEKTVHADGLKDAIELAIAPNGDVFFIEREGRIFRSRPSTGGVFLIGELEVEALRATDRESSYAREDGMLGLALDPEFEKNQRVYIYYSAPEKSVNRLSRFLFEDGKIEKKTEHILLEIPTDRENRVCHHGGSLKFGPDGLLYLSTGDNTNPFESDGYSPSDHRQDRHHVDATRSASNTNDLRGKILRIKVTEEGYEIPAGNLFPPGTEKARPEIYVMGCRNPYRISIDPKTRTLYWGEVGPDAGEEKDRGPRGHDEVNQAKGPGFFGWPLFVGDNKPYAKYDFETKEIGDKHDPARPMNSGPNHTGLDQLPPAQPALIWYPYAESPEFPVMGKGGRNAMAGPVFYYDESRRYNILSKEDDRTLLVYDWMRGKIWKAKLDDKEKLSGLETWLEGFTHPIDLEMADDGSLWLLEYGSEWWFGTNGKLIQMKPPTGNQAPELAIEADSATPNQFKVKSATDADGDKITVTWYITKGVVEEKIGTGSKALITDSSATEIRAVASDGKGGNTVAKISLVAAAADAELIAKLAGDPKSLTFAQEIGFTLESPVQLDLAKTSIRVRYIPPTGHDAGGPQLSQEMQALATARQCLACHNVETAVVGPSYLSVAVKYRNQADASDFLKNKLKHGGAGVWGEIPMPAQPALTDEENAKLVAAILGLAEGITEVRNVKQGTIQLPPAPDNAAPGGAWEIIAESPGHVSAKFRLPAK